MGDFTDWYVAETKRRFRERADDPLGSFTDQLQQGTTGPAPAPTEMNSAVGWITGQNALFTSDTGEGVFGAINDSAITTMDRATGNARRGNQGSPRWLRFGVIGAIVLFVTYVVGQLFTIELGGNQ